MFRTIVLFTAALCATVVLFVAGQAAIADGISPAEKAIEKALDSSTQVQVIEMPLHDVMDYLKSHHKIEIQLDTKALGDVGIHGDEPITKQLKGLSLRSVLNLILDDLELTYMIANEVLLITTPEQAETHLSTKVYPVADLIDDNGDALVNLIKSTVMPDSWDEVGGPGNITGGSFGGAETIVISQTYHIHREIAELLAKLRKVAGDSSPTARAQPPSNTQVFWPRGEISKIQKALASETEVEFDETPLCEVADFLKARHGIEIHIDREALGDVGLGTDEPVTTKVKGISLRAALRLMLRELELTYMIQDEVLLITTPEESHEPLSTRMYPVSDLVGGPNVLQPPRAGLEGLAKTISQTIVPDSWDAVGGPASISTPILGGVPVLIISQTSDVHGQIVAWLTEIRRMVAASKDKLPTPTPGGRSGWGCIHYGPSGIGGGMGGMGGGMF